MAEAVPGKGGRVRLEREEHNNRGDKNGAAKRPAGHIPLRKDSTDDF